MNNLNGFKVTLTALFTALSALLGWLGWLFVLFIGCLTADWISGTMAARKNGDWSSKKGREGIWHKAGCLVVVLVTIALDILIGTVVNNIPSVHIPFTYTVLLCPIILVWYILTEFGSIIENAAKMGAPIPIFLKKAIALFKNTVDAAGNKFTESAEQPKPPNII